MKIIQIMSCDGNLHGLGDDGTLYRFRHAREPWKHDTECYKSIVSGAIIKSPHYSDGCTAGWVKLCDPGVMSKPVPHPDDPTKCERC